MKALFDKVQMNNLIVKNRLIRSATWEGIADPYGNIDERCYRIYEELARGGVGLIIGGFTSVAENDFYFDGMMRLSNDSLIPQYRKLTDLIHLYDSKVLAQLALGAFYRNGAQIEPDYMTEGEIKSVIQWFIDAATRAEKAGFDGVQIHAAHFFFLSRFISPRVNHRTDNYGGNTDNRTRILSEIMDGIRKVCPALHITIKINSSDFTYGGLEHGNLVESDISDGINDENRKKLAKIIATKTGDNEVGTIASNGQTKCFYSKIDPTALTFDNHIEYYRGIDNLRDAEGSLNPNALRVFKVYAYMIKTNGDGTEEYYFSDAVNLQMYELATS